MPQHRRSSPVQCAARGWHRRLIGAFAALVFVAGPLPSPAVAQPTVVPVQAQAQGESGLSLRVSGIAAHEDHTVLQVAVSFANQRRPGGAQLAHHDTFLLTDGGDRLMLQRPAQSPTLPLDNNASMEGELTFLGAIPAGTRQLTLVLNDGNSPTHTQAPELRVPVELPPPLQAQLRVHSVSAGDAGQAAYPVQASNAGGLTVQVKSLTREADSTRLAVSVSFSNRRRPQGTQLAGRETFLRTADGQKFMLQRSQDNPKLQVANDDTLVGDLVFQGVLPADAQGAELVFNDGSAATATTSSGMVVALPVQ